MPFWSTIAETERWQVIYYVKTFSERFKKDTAPKVVTVGSVASTPDSIKRGQELFKETKCFECHGEDGRGNGPFDRSFANGMEYALQGKGFIQGMEF